MKKNLKYKFRKLKVEKRREKSCKTSTVYSNKNIYNAINNYHKYGKDSQIKDRLKSVKESPKCLHLKLDRKSRNIQGDNSQNCKGLGQ